MFKGVNGFVDIVEEEGSSYCIDDEFSLPFCDGDDLSQWFFECKNLIFANKSESFVKRGNLSLASVILRRFEESYAATVKTVNEYLREGKVYNADKVVLSFGGGIGAEIGISNENQANSSRFSPNYYQFYFSDDEEFDLSDCDSDDNRSDVLTLPKDCLSFTPDLLTVPQSITPANCQDLKESWVLVKSDLCSAKITDVRLKRREIFNQLKDDLLSCIAADVFILEAFDEYNRIHDTLYTGSGNGIASRHLETSAKHLLGIYNEGALTGGLGYDPDLCISAEDLMYESRATNKDTPKNTQGKYWHKLCICCIASIVGLGCVALGIFLWVEKVNGLDLLSESVREQILLSFVAVLVVCVCVLCCVFFISGKGASNDLSVADNVSDIDDELPCVESLGLDTSPETVVFSVDYVSNPICKKIGL